MGITAIFDDPLALRELARSAATTELWCQTAQVALYDAAEEIERLRALAVKHEEPK